MRFFLCLLSISAVLITSACSSGGSGNKSNTHSSGVVSSSSSSINSEPSAAPIAGDTTVNNKTSAAFSQHVKNLRDVERIRLFNIGDDFFENPWVEKTSSTELRDGLGPLFNNNACQDCHVRDGRGHAPLDDSSEADHFNRMIFKAVRTSISIEETELMESGMLGSIGDRAAGGQLQHHAILGVEPEVNLAVRYEYSQVSFSDGHTEELRRPMWNITLREPTLNFDTDTLFSPRIAQSMQGGGLLALIPEAEILKLADPLDEDQDGISGRANRVWDVQTSAVTLGRFGWKAGQPNIRQQAAGAFNGDMGLTSEIFPVDHCLDHQTLCRNSPNGNGDSLMDYEFEVATDVLDAIEFYAMHLAVPARRNPNSADVVAGEQLFTQAGCHHCHQPTFTTENNPQFPELSEQNIFPYSDMLLHDMGAGLADIDINNLPGSFLTPVEYSANAREWRTTPLWGLGLVKIVLPDAGYLHDGRARTIMEAILWHGGEAEESKNAVLNFNAQQRRELIAFLEDL